MMEKICYICNSGNFVDTHHIDCQGGKVSPETVPLCRRCHRTLHDWGIGAFSPDTTDKALEVENRRREIFGLSPMKPEDIRRSGYWYKKHHITPPSLGRKKPSRRMPFRIPAGTPLCGEDWLREHLVDHTPEEIGALTIVIGCDNRRLPPVSVANKRGTVAKAILRQRSR